MKYITISIPCIAQEEAALEDTSPPVVSQTLTVRLFMSSLANAQDAAELLSEKLEHALNTIDTGDCT